MTMPSFNLYGLIICSLSVAYVQTRHEQRSPSNLKKSGNRRTLFQTSISLFQLNSGGENLVYYHNRRGILVHPEEDLAVKMKKIRERRNMVTASLPPSLSSSRRRRPAPLCTIPHMPLGSSWEVAGKWVDENSKMRTDS